MILYRPSDPAAPGPRGGRRRVAARVALAVLLVAGAAHTPASAQQPPGAQEPSDAVLPAVAVRHLDAQMADLGTPAFVDGLAGLLVIHAGRDPQRAGALARQVLGRAPDAQADVARAMRLAGFDPASLSPANLSADAATTAAAEPAPSGAGASPGAGLSPGALATPSATQTLRPGPAALATPQLR